MQIADTAGPFFSPFIVPMLIFLARILDVSMGTLRIMFVSRGRKKLAALLGFFEVLVWLVVISQVMQNLTNVINYVAYAGGFAAGNYVGLYIEERLAMGLLGLRIITQQSPGKLVEQLRAQEIGTTTVAAQGQQGQVHVVFSIIRRRDWSKFMDVVRKHNPTAFLSVEDVRTVKYGVFPAPEPDSGFFKWLRPFRKGK